MYLWTNEEVQSILIQLDRQGFPFPDYSMGAEKEGVDLLGKGGYALVFEAALREYPEEKDYAIKVIGFGEKTVDSAEFTASVEAQRALYTDKGNIVRVYDYMELWVELNEDIHVKAVKKVWEGRGAGNCLKLQFVLMEKLESVLFREETGKYRLYPEKLDIFDEQEINRLAQHIAGALQLAHSRNVLHRDVKLENVFYDKKRDVYKLGDFGNAKVTADGMASTAAYTKGYGAPEVIRSMEDRYSSCADMYSLGMLLYVLLNGLRFPESGSYRVNVTAQYQRGYIVPVPASGVSALYKVARKMCMYEPRNRYQSMQEVQTALGCISLGERVYYMREKKRSSLVMSMILLFAGFGLKGFSGQEYQWLIITLFSLGGVLLWQYIVWCIGGTKELSFYYKRNFFWIIICALYFELIWLGILFDGGKMRWLFSEETILVCRELELAKVGIAGSIFCLVWLVREWILDRIEAKQT